MKTLISYRITAIGGLLALVLLGASLIFNLDTSEIIISFLQRFEAMELDELILAILVFGIAFAIDIVKKHYENLHSRDIEKQKLHVLRATMVTVMDTVNTLIASIQLFRYELEELQPEEELQTSQLDKTVDNTIRRLRHLQRMEVINEKKLGDNIYAIDMPI